MDGGRFWICSVSIDRGRRAGKRYGGNEWGETGEQANHARFMALSRTPHKGISANEDGDPYWNGSILNS